MAFPTAVNDQITDAVTQTNVKVLGEAPALALGSVYQTMARSTGVLFEQAVAAQQQSFLLNQAAASMGVTMLYTLPTAQSATTALTVSESLLKLLNSAK